MRKRKNTLRVILPCLAAIFLTAGSALAEKTVTAAKVGAAPSIDGDAGDSAWASAKATIVKDTRTGSDVTLKAVYTSDSVFFLVQYPDATEDRLHKPLVWDKSLEVYKPGPQREDTFQFKWSMMNRKVNLSPFSDDDHKADVWYWKANRSDPAGYADDKMDIVSGEPGKNATEVKSETGKKRFLMRPGDTGNPAEKSKILTSYVGDVVDQYEIAAPTGSRADVKAKGLWKKGSGWTIEFGRKLDTGHDDDIVFDLSKKYLFVISIPGMYGEPINKDAPHPYGQGRPSEPIVLEFK